MARVLITGAGGLLGGDLVRHCETAGHEVVALRDRADVDLADRGALEQRLSGQSLDYVFHVAALTAVDRAEKDPAAAWGANVLGTRNVAALAKDRGAKLLFVSTASVFSGHRGNYREDEAPQPTNYYSWTKVVGEEAVLAVGGIVMRATIIGVQPGRTARNFVEWLRDQLAADKDLTLFTDVRMNALASQSAARIAHDLLERAPAGSLWHAGTTDLCTKADVGRWVQEQHFPDFRGQITFAPIPDLPGGAARPKEMWLDVSAIQSLVPMPTVSGELQSMPIRGSR